MSEQDWLREVERLAQQLQDLAARHCCLNGRCRACRMVAANAAALDLYVRAYRGLI